MVDSSCARHGFAPNRLRLIATASGLMTESASRSSRSTHASTPGLAPEHAAMLRRGDSRLGAETPVNGASRANPEFRRGTVTRRWLGYPIPVLSEAVCPERFHRCLLRQCSVSHENASLARFAGLTRGVRRCPGHPPPSRPHRPRARSARCVVGHAHPASLRLTRRRAASTRYRTGSARTSATGQPSARGCPERSASMRSRTWWARRGSLTTGVPISARSAATSCIAWRATSRLRPPRWWRSERGIRTHDLLSVFMRSTD